MFVWHETVAVVRLQEILCLVLASLSLLHCRTKHSFFVHVMANIFFLVEQKNIVLCSCASCEQVCDLGPYVGLMKH